jgi:hypothetical protein
MHETEISGQQLDNSLSHTCRLHALLGESIKWRRILSVHMLNLTGHYRSIVAHVVIELNRLVCNSNSISKLVLCAVLSRSIALSAP